MSRLRLAFLGTPDFAVPTLNALVAEHDVVAVYTQPARPSGRGQRPQPSPVHQVADARRIPVHTPETLRDAVEQEAFLALGLDAAVVVAYGRILPKEILEGTRLGCFNVHASLLPRWRGAAPIHRAIMAGDTETGVMVMRMDEGLDTGPILAEWRTPIDDETTMGPLRDLLAEEGAKLMAATLPHIADGTAVEEIQPAEGATYAKKITPEEARIEWRKPAREVLRHIHGLNPQPGAWTMMGTTRLKILRAEVVKETKGRAGSVLDNQLTVACGGSAVRILELQRPGKEVQSAQAFLRGFDLPADAKFT